VKVVFSCITVIFAVEDDVGRCLKQFGGAGAFMWVCSMGPVLGIVFTCESMFSEEADRGGKNWARGSFYSLYKVWSLVGGRMKKGSVGWVSVGVLSPH
jgi:hypothetical protein